STARVVHGRSDARGSCSKTARPRVELRRGAARGEAREHDERERGYAAEVHAPPILQRWHRGVSGDASRFGQVGRPAPQRANDRETAAPENSATSTSNARVLAR